MKQNILVTGASSGFGLLIANKLHESGHNVIGTSRNPEKYATKLPFKMIALDLDSEQSINTFSDRVFKEISRLDVLINNAGFLVSGIAEETPIELGRQQLETNFWGTIKVTNAVLPYFRKQKFGIVQTDKPKFRNIVGKGTSTLINLQHFAYGILENEILKKLNKF